jgi:putative ABC transport system permease protein
MRATTAICGFRKIAGISSAIVRICRRGGIAGSVLARLAAGEATASAKTQLTALGGRMAMAYPQSNRGRSFTIVSDFDYRLKQAGDNGLVVLAIVVLVVVISSVNVANLLLSRANVHGKEMAVRPALGASRMRLITQLMVESLMLGEAGLAVGMTLGWWLIAWMPSLLIAPPGFRLQNDFEFNSRVLIFSIAVTLATTLLFGLAPALRFTRPNLVPALKTDSVFAVSAGRLRWPMRNGGDRPRRGDEWTRAFSGSDRCDRAFVRARHRGGRRQVLSKWLRFECAFRGGNSGGCSRRRAGRDRRGDFE